ncbi:MAG: hypothetical protein ABEH61_02980 [Haloarculaceae archaeon]
MLAVRNPATGTWHLLGTRGCGQNPDGETVDATWSKIRDRVDRDDGDRCSNCNWPPGGPR